MTVTLNSSSSRQLTSVSCSSFSGVLSCFFVWNVFLAIFILSACFYVLHKVGKLNLLVLKKWPYFPVGPLFQCPHLSPEPGGLAGGLV